MAKVLLKGASHEPSIDFATTSSCREPHRFCDEVPEWIAS